MRLEISAAVVEASEPSREDAPAAGLPKVETCLSGVLLTGDGGEDATYEIIPASCAVASPTGPQLCADFSRDGHCLHPDLSENRAVCPKIDIVRAIGNQYGLYALLAEKVYGLRYAGRAA